MIDSSAICCSSIQGQKKLKKPIRDGAGEEQHLNFIYIEVMREKYIGHAYSIRETNSFNKVQVKQICIKICSSKYIYNIYTK